MSPALALAPYAGGRETLAGGVSTLDCLRCHTTRRFPRYEECLFYRITVGFSLGESGLSDKPE